MQDIKKREDKIKEKRMKTDFRDFLKEIVSWSSLNLYKNKEKICRYPDTERIKVLDNKGALDTSGYFIDQNENQTFFQNFRNLFDKVPLQFMLDFGDNERSEFADQVFGAKDTYLSFVIGFNVERVLYSAFCYVNIHNVLNSYFINTNCGNIYFSAGVINSTNIFYSRYIKDSYNVRFSTNLMGCEECLFCDNLQNKKYVYRNKALSKDEYFMIKSKILQDKEKFDGYYKEVLGCKAINYLSEQVNGVYNIHCFNVENGYFVTNTKNSRNIINTGGDDIEHFYDCFDVGVQSHNFYAVAGAGDNCSYSYCSTQLTKCTYVFYSYFLINCSYCLGCIGLKNKQFCIFNKQYTKEERSDLANKIFAQMDKDGILGDFFPGSMNPFYFNDTAAYLIDDSFTKEEVEAEGYLRRDEEIKVDIPQGLETLKSTELDQYQGFDSNGIREIKPEILKKVIIDEKGNYYRIVKMEYDFLVKHGLPLPEIHWLDRIKLGFKFK